MDEQTSTLGPLMKAARKFKKFNQADVAKAIGCSQSALSKMEHNLLVPSAPQWFLFSRFTGIPPESLEKGIIDRKVKVKFNSTEVSLGFKIPKKYRQYRSIKVRELYPFVTFLEKQDIKKKEAFFKHMGLEEEFFLDFDNLVNFQFFLDVIQFFIQEGLNDEEAIRGISKEQGVLYWNRYLVHWKECHTNFDLLNAYAEVQPYFQMDFQLKVEDHGELTVGYFSEYHIKYLEENVNSDQIDFLNRYRARTLENLVLEIREEKVNVGLTSEIPTSPFGARFYVKKVS